MKKNETYKDRGLRLAMQQRNETAEKMTLSEDFTDRLMQRIEQKEEQPKHKRTWLYTTIGAVAASILLLLAIHYKYDKEDPNQKPAIAQKTEQRESSSTLESQRQDGRRQSQQAEQQQDIPIEAKEVTKAPLIAQEKHGEEKATVGRQQQNTASAVHKTSTDIPTTDSLDYYIDKIERELAQVDESLYIERMNKVIRADERLQRIVNSYILHTLDKEGRPQTADNMYNVKTEQDEE